MFSFVENCQSLISNVVVPRYTASSNIKCSNCATSLSTLGIVSLFNFSHPAEYIIVSNCRYIHIFLMTNGVEHWLFIYLCEIFVQIFSPPFCQGVFSVYLCWGVDYILLNCKIGWYFPVFLSIGSRYEFLHDTWAIRNARLSYGPQCLKP